MAANTVNLDVVVENADEVTEKLEKIKSLLSEIEELKISVFGEQG